MMKAGNLSFTVELCMSVYKIKPLLRVATGCLDAINKYFRASLKVDPTSLLRPDAQCALPLSAHMYVVLVRRHGEELRKVASKSF